MRYVTILLALLLITGCDNADQERIDPDLKQQRCLRARRWPTART